MNTKETVKKIKQIYQETDDDPIEVDGVKIKRSVLWLCETHPDIDIWPEIETLIQKEEKLEQERDRIKDKAVNKEKPFLKNNAPVV